MVSSPPRGFNFDEEEDASLLLCGTSSLRLVSA
jgi:hypothetical protein